jgi:hypothetical protein
MVPPYHTTDLAQVSSIPDAQQVHPTKSQERQEANRLVAPDRLRALLLVRSPPLRLVTSVHCIPQSPHSTIVAFDLALGQTLQTHEPQSKSESKSCWSSMLAGLIELAGINQPAGVSSNNSSRRPPKNIIAKRVKSNGHQPYELGPNSTTAFGKMNRPYRLIPGIRPDPIQSNPIQPIEFSCIGPSFGTCLACTRQFREGDLGDWRQVAVVSTEAMQANHHPLQLIVGIVDHHALHAMDCRLFGFDFAILACLCLCCVSCQSGTTTGLYASSRSNTT